MFGHYGSNSVSEYFIRLFLHPFAQPLPSDSDLPLPRHPVTSGATYSSVVLRTFPGTHGALLCSRRPVLRPPYLVLFIPVIRPSLQTLLRFSRHSLTDLRISVTDPGQPFFLRTKVRAFGPPITPSGHRFCVPPDAFPLDFIISDPSYVLFYGQLALGRLRLRGGWALQLHYLVQKFSPQNHPFTTSEIISASSGPTPLTPHLRAMGPLSICPISPGPIGHLTSIQSSSSGLRSMFSGPQRTISTPSGVVLWPSIPWKPSILLRVCDS